MAKSKDHIDKKGVSKEEMLRYLADDMNDKERHQIERKMLDDDFASEAMEGLAGLSKDAIQSDLDTLKAKIKGKKPERKIPVLYWRIAAAVTLLLVFSFAIYFVLDSNKELPLAREKAVAPQKQDSSAAASPELTERSNSNQPETDTLLDNKESEPEDRMLAMEKKPEGEQAKAKEPVTEEPDLDLAPAEEARDQMSEQKPAQSVAPQTEVNAPQMVPPTTGGVSQSAGEVASSPSLPPAQTEDIVSDRKMDIARSRAATAMQPEARKKAMDMKTISGKIMSSDDQEPIPGANIVLKGTTRGVTSDVNGDFVFEVPKGAPDTLVISSVGYNTEKVPVKDNEKIDVALDADVSSLSEVVVTGYGVSNVGDESDYSYTPPQPENGKGAFNEYVDTHLKYPPSEIGRGVKGTVKLKFTVDTNGNIADIQIVKSLGDAFDQEAIRLLKEGPRWEPARESGQPVAREVTLKIRFKPPE